MARRTHARPNAGSGVPAAACAGPTLSPAQADQREPLPGSRARNKKVRDPL